MVRAQLQVLQTAAHYLECPPEEVDRKVRALIEEMQLARKEINRIGQAMARADFESLIANARAIDGATLLSAQVDVRDIDMLRQMTDWFREQHSSGVIVLGAVIDERPHLIAAVTEDLVQRGVSANDLVKSIARLVGGGGGGRPTLAQAGGRDASRLDDALASVQEFVVDRLGTD
jgi:alanyl-tRNA synthetase